MRSYPIDYLGFFVSSTGIIALVARWMWTKQRARLLTKGFIFSITLIFICGYFWINRQEETVKDNQRTRLLGFAPTYAIELEKLGHEQLNLHTSPNSPLYLALIEREKSWLSVNPAVADIYTFKKKPDGSIALMVDSETDYDHNGKYEGEREQRTPIGENYDKVGHELKEAFEGNSRFVDEIYSDRWGTWISAFVPLHDRTGKVDAVLGVDYPAESLLKEIAFIRRTYISYLAVLLIVILGFTCAYQLVLFELHERKRAEAELETSRMKHMRLAKLSALGEMAAGIAHEINNPLAIIIGKTTQFKRKLKSLGATPDAFQDIERIELTAERIAKIVKGLRSFSRSGENDPMTDVSLTQVITETLDLCREKFKFSQIEMRIDLTGGQNTIVRGRDTQLSQVFLNLLGNAYDAVALLSEKWIFVSIECDSEWARIRFKDSGKGIPEAIHEKIMQPFFTTKAIDRGTGLGLSISKGLVEDHQGHLLLDTSSANTCFVVELPIAQKNLKAA